MNQHTVCFRKIQVQDLIISSLLYDICGGDPEAMQTNKDVLFAQARQQLRETTTDTEQACCADLSQHTEG